MGCYFSIFVPISEYYAAHFNFYSDFGAKIGYIYIMRPLTDSGEGTVETLTSGMGMGENLHSVLDRDRSG